ncbi:MAG TPA: YdeI/OmpD-associated family protein [Longimicrobiales bacterium]|nr:YdeI/OmpD-associated family protein [Longimicrobiales bacterium]
MSDPTFFAKPAALRRWLQKNHAATVELWVGFHKKATGTPSITWPEAVDQALCFGWIDGIRKSLGPDRYMIRFTPRRPGSIWSAVNTKRAQELIELGLMQPAGAKAFAGRDAAKTQRYSYEREQAELSADQLKQFRANRRAWRFFQAQPPGYRKIATVWVVSAKQEATRQRRLATLIADSAAGQRIGLLRRPTKDAD